ncbi:Pyranose 2-oxidase [Entomortierella chlamydospora]|nr:Pyranose 2-oxidase [Entomortierella chlamydospora]
MFLPPALKPPRVQEKLKMGHKECDVLIVGSGPIGCGFARTLLDPAISRLVPEQGPEELKKLKVVIVDIGQHLSNVPGENVKNAYYYQRNVNNFTPIVQGTMQPISIAPNSTPLPYPTDPTVFEVKGANYVINNINPDQDESVNMPAAATTYAIGGMGTHWTCCVPRMAEGVERPPDDMGIPCQEWDELYEKAESMFLKSDTIFDSSLRQKVLLETLENHRSGCVKMPIAGQLNKHDKEQIVWSGADTVLGKLVDMESARRINEKFDLEILDQHRCTRLVVNYSDDGKNGDVVSATVRNLREKKDINIRAKYYVVACNPILTPQLLYNSGIRPEALGRYLMDQPMTFCQILLSKKIVRKIEKEAVDAELIPSDPERRKDPVPIPISDLPPALILKVNESRHWHAQIHKDTFSYGMVPQSIDPRLVIDLRWFGPMEAERHNRVYFDGRSDSKDLMGMPQPTFDITLSDKDKEHLSRMMKDMTDVAHILGGFLPGAEPRFMPMGTSLHFQGTTRYGPQNDGTSVVDPNSKVWGISNLFLGGNGLIPTPMACNPTLTSLGLAVKAARQILRQHYGKVRTPTPEEEGLGVIEP